MDTTEQTAALMPPDDAADLTAQPALDLGPILDMGRGIKAPVRVVLACAKPTCTACSGTGLIRRHGVKEARLCGCAHRRFMASLEKQIHAVAAADGPDAPAADPPQAPSVAYADKVRARLKRLQDEADAADAALIDADGKTSEAIQQNRAIMDACRERERVNLGFAADHERVAKMLREAAERLRRDAFAQEAAASEHDAHATGGRLRAAACAREAADSEIELRDKEAAADRILAPHRKRAATAHRRFNAARIYTAGVVTASEVE